MQAYKNYVVFVCWHCDFRIYLGWRQPTELRCTAGQILFCIIHLYLPGTFWAVGIESWYLAAPTKCKLTANRFKPQVYVFFGKHICLHKKLGVGQRENWKEKVEVPRWLDIRVYIHSADPPDFDFLNRKLVVATPTPKMRLYKVLKWYEVIG